MVDKRTGAPFVAGDDIEFVVDFVIGGKRIDVTGDKVYLTLKRSEDDSDADAALQIEYIIPVEQASSEGRATIKITSEESAVESGSYFYDYKWIRTVSGEGKVVTVQMGKVQVLKGITDAVI